MSSSWNFPVHDFLVDEKSRDDAHRFVIDAAWTNTVQGPGGHREELQVVFLVDLSKSQVRELFDKLQRVAGNVVASGDERWLASHLVYNNVGVVQRKETHYSGWGWGSCQGRPFFGRSS